jgi:hypothetical protein
LIGHNLKLFLLLAYRAERQSALDHRGFAMTRPMIAGLALLASAIVGIANAPAVSASVSPSASSATSSAASSAAGKVNVRHWLGTWSGKLSQKPAPVPGDPKNPYKVVVTIRSVAKHNIGTVRYPVWKCGYTLVKESATPKKLSFLMKVFHPGPFNCVSRETVVLRSKAKSASFKGTFAGGTESGTVSKSS